MSGLPNGWARATLPELISSGGVFVDGDWVESKDQDPDGDVRLIQLADVGDGRYVNKSSRFLTSERAGELGCTFLEPGDLLIARMPEPLGRACLFPGDSRKAVTVVDVCVVRGDEEDFDSKWLMHFVNAAPFREGIYALQSGSTRKRISRGNLATLRLPVPPRREQGRIANMVDELLSDLDVGEAELKAAQKKLTQYRQSLLKAAVEGALTADWRAQHPPSETGAQLLQRILTERRACWEAKQLAKFNAQGKAPPKDWQKKYPEPVQPDTTDLPELPQDWTWCCLDALMVDGPQNGLYLPGDRYGRGTAILRIDDYQIGWHRDREDLRTVEADTESLLIYGLRAGDLVINRVNSMTHLGKSMLIDSRLQGCLFESNMMRIGLTPLVDARLIERYLGSDLGRARLTKSAKWAVNQASINQQDVCRTPVPLPPLEEQQTIVKCLESQLESAIGMNKSLQQAERQSTAQRQNILRAAFSGQLVPQDPNDEPAAELLARIRAERAAQAPARKLRGRQKEAA